MSRRRKKIPPNTWRICLNEEAPRIGTGWRFVQLMSAGRKWARIRELATDRTARLPAETWSQIIRRGHQITQ
ncbi:MAG: hypothetical protein EHM35_07395 [Planctomycetaceae bacterium]|nr:MAG: hypothetical protein EHM35_07395 [Planctomycetaceae bacterium]